MRRLSCGIRTNLGIKTIAKVDYGCTFLEDSEGANDGSWHAIGVPCDVKVLKGPLGLGSPETVGGDLDGSEGVSLLAE